jgi:lysyl-tRNA synthetase class 2
MKGDPTIWLERAELKNITRRFFETREYVEVDTPIAVKCPGTEVYLQYFTTSWVDHSRVSHPLFLRSSPELHMKRIVSEGLSRIFQLAPCFRNHGEFSEWHQPEFTMLEWYHLGLSYHGLVDETEAYLRYCSEEMSSFLGKSLHALLPEKFERISVYQAFKDFVGVELVDGDPELARQCKTAGVHSIVGHEDFDSAFFKVLIERIEPQLAMRKGAVLMDYPPSQAALAKVESGRACRFEFYLGRVELCNGFFELTGERENRLRLEDANRKRVEVGLDSFEIDEQFVKAMGRIHKPLAGNALGFDRWLALLCGRDSLDGVIPFRGDLGNAGI